MLMTVEVACVGSSLDWCAAIRDGINLAVGHKGMPWEGTAPYMDQTDWDALSEIVGRHIGKAKSALPMPVTLDSIKAKLSPEERAILDAALASKPEPRLRPEPKPVRDPLKNPVAGDVWMNSEDSYCLRRVVDEGGETYTQYFYDGSTAGQQDISLLALYGGECVKRGDE